jgi:signal transduction histidine kinase
MKRIPRHKRILALMLVSQVLLLALVVQWIRSQYREQRENLANELTSIYIDTRDRVVDTMLFRNYVRPVVSHQEVIINYQINDTVRSHRNLAMIRRDEGKAGGDEGPNVGYVVTAEMIPGKDSLIKDTLRIRRMSDAMILRSVRMIVTHTQDTLGREPAKKFHSAISPDTTVFVTCFQDSLKNSGMKFKVKWFNNADSVIAAGHLQTLTIGPGSPFGLPEASVTKYNGYLFRRISPQIIFSLVLLVLTGLAFRLSYRSIREHVILGAMRNEFISNMTHELKTPVATLSVALESLGKYGLKNDPAASDEFIRLASLETRRLEALINRVLSQSVLEQKGTILETGRVDLNSLIREVADTMKPRLGQGGTIEFLPGEDPLEVDGDSLFLKEVIVNLVDNSIKYCDKTPVITIRSGKSGGNAFFSVDDNGPGIPPEYRKKVFDKFFRLPSSNVHNVKGFGLGLSFSKLVVDLHNGEITVRDLSPGCSFTVKIPAD